MLLLLTPLGLLPTPLLPQAAPPLPPLAPRKSNLNVFLPPDIFLNV